MVNYVRINPVTGERGINMKCKFCSAELDQDTSICPMCGKNQEDSAEETPTVTEKKKSNVWKIILAAAGGVVLLAILVGAVLYGFGINILPRENNLLYKNSYTVKDSTAEKKQDIIVATMGDQVLTNGELQAYYWTGVFDYLNYYGYYLQLSGVDFSQPLNKLIYDEKTGMTYQQYFLNSAINSWRGYVALDQLSKEAGFVPTEEHKTYLESLRTQIEKAAKDKGYADPEEFIDKEMFPGCSVDAYIRYNSLGYTALAYYDTLFQTMMPTQEQIEAYYTAHEAELKEKGYHKDNGNYYDVRHILIEPTGGTKNDDGETVYTDAEWEACRAAAQKILDEFLAGTATEEAFGSLATTTPIFLPGEFHGQRSLMGYSPQGRKEADMTE